MIHNVCKHLLSIIYVFTLKHSKCLLFLNKSALIYTFNFFSTLICRFLCTNSFKDTLFNGCRHHHLMVVNML